MTDKLIVVVDKKSAALDTLMHKLEAWLQQQGEWPLLFLDDRKTRRRVAQEVAKRVYTLPTRQP